jgi:DNA-damage-inducible protein J
MSEQTVVQTSIDTNTAKAVQAVLETSGLSVSEAMRMVLRQIACEKHFEIPHIPNAETQEALEASARNEGVFTTHNIQELFEHLDKGVERDD